MDVKHVLHVIIVLKIQHVYVLASLKKKRKNCGKNKLLNRLQYNI
jgi:hypothetical protein